MSEDNQQSIDKFLPSYLVLNGEGGATSIDINAIANLDPNKQLWILVDLATAKQLLPYLPSMNEHQHDILTGDTANAVSIIGSDCYMATLEGTHFVAPQQNEPLTARLWIKENIIVTVVEADNNTFKTLLLNLQNNCGAKDIVSLINKLFRVIVNKSSRSIATMGQYLDDVEEYIGKNEREQAREMTFDMRTQMVTIRRDMCEQREAAYKLSAIPATWVDSTARAIFDAIGRACERGIADLDAEGSRAEIITGLISDLAQEDMNRKVYHLTVITMIFMPLSFITGYLGINVGGIPWATASYGFLGVGIILAVLCIAQLIGFKITGWF